MKTELAKFKDNAIEIDENDAWRAESALRISMIQYKKRNNLFFFKTEADADKAFRLFNRLKLIIY